MSTTKKPVPPTAKLRRAMGKLVRTAIARAMKGVHPPSEHQAIEDAHLKAGRAVLDELKFIDDALWLAKTELRMASEAVPVVPSSPVQQYGGNAGLEPGVSLQLMMQHLQAGGFVLMGRGYANDMSAPMWKELMARYAVVLPDDIFNPQEKPT